MNASAVVVELHPGAWDDLFNAAAAYESERAHLGDRFVTAVAGGLEGLGTFPRKGRSLARAEAGAAEFRVARVLRFPYKIVYRLRLEVVYVIAIWHDARSPGAWLRRVEGK